MAGLTTNRDLNDLIEESIEEGFKITKCGNGHLKWTPPNFPEAAFVCAATPSSKRVVNHVRLQKKRALAGYSCRLNPAKKDIALARLGKMNKKKEPKVETTAALKDQPFRKLLRGAKTMPPEFATPKIAKIKFSKYDKEAITMWEGAKKAKALSEKTSKPLMECCVIVAEAFHCLTPFKAPTDAKGLYNLLNKKPRAPKVVVAPEPEPVFEAPVKEEIKLAAESITVPEIPVIPEPVALAVLEPVAVVVPEPKIMKIEAPRILSAAEQVLEHVRSVISLPIPKQQRMDIVIDILDKSLT